MTSHFCRLISLFVFLLVLVPASVTAQQPAQVFALPEAHAGEGYRVELETVLRERYGLRIESGARNAIIQWALADGDVPAGISVRTDGTIIGQPDVAHADAYRFRLRVIDVSVKDEQLLIDVSLVVKAGRLRLSKIEGPRLVPADMRSSPANDDATNAATSPSLPAVDVPGRDAKALSNSGNNSSGQPKDDQGATTGNEASADQKEINNPFSSLNKRFILGFEQSGAASSDATGRPFFDVFINTPLSRNDSPCDPQMSANDKATKEKAPCAPPRFSVWGDVRLTSTPEQINAFGNVVSNAVGTITGAKVNQLASAFDFVVGPEMRLERFHHTDFSLIAGFGAISPVSPRQSAQIFQVPDAASSQAPAFFKQYPGAQGKQFIAFISPDRDRFFRQYFGGFRFKTFSYETEKDTNGKVKPDTNGNPIEHLSNVFPATFDITFGQSEAVTGGRLHKFVVGLDGFYPLPFPDNSRFLYLFGSARFKAGGPKNIGTPFILDTAASSVTITDPKVFIADPTPTNRDTYRIGFGVDLVELFKFAKSQGKEQGKADQKKQDQATKQD
jgi:hypothetical protein